MAGGGLEHGAVSIGELEGISQERDRFSAWGAPLAAFERANPLGAQPRPRGQLFHGQPAVRRERRSRSPNVWMDAIAIGGFPSV